MVRLGDGRVWWDVLLGIVVTWTCVLLLLEYAFYFLLCPRVEMVMERLDF
jgi:hypothetical protein